MSKPCDLQICKMAPLLFPVARPMQKPKACPGVQTKRKLLIYPGFDGQWECSNETAALLQRVRNPPRPRRKSPCLHERKDVSLAGGDSWPRPNKLTSKLWLQKTAFQRHWHGDLNQIKWWQIPINMSHHFPQFLLHEKYQLSSSSGSTAGLLFRSSTKNVACLNPPCLWCRVAIKTNTFSKVQNQKVWEILGLRPRRAWWRPSREPRDICGSSSHSRTTSYYHTVDGWNLAPPGMYETL